MNDFEMELLCILVHKFKGHYDFKILASKGAFA